MFICLYSKYLHAVCEKVFTSSHRFCQCETAPKAEAPVRQTLQECSSRGAVEFVGAAVQDEEGHEKLRVHANLLLSTLAAICELDVSHTALPWKVSIGLDPSMMQHLLEYMEAEWFFVNSVVDRLDSKDQLWKLLSHTRWQVYRDVLTKGQYRV